MKKNRLLIRLFIFLICLGLVWPLETDILAMQSRARASAQKKISAGKNSRGASRSRGRGRGSVDTTPRPAFDKIMSENRALLSESGDAELAASQIEESKLRANVKYLADDLLE